MNSVWLFSYIPIALSVAEMVAVCLYSKSGWMKILYRRIIVEGEGPSFWLKNFVQFVYSGLCFGYSDVNVLKMWGFGRMLHQGI